MHHRHIPLPPGTLIANGSLNALGSLLMVGGFFPLVVLAGKAAAEGRVAPAFMIGISLFGGCTIYRFVMATISSFMNLKQLHPTLRALEEAGTFFLPAGVYMPFILSSLAGLWGWLLLGLTLAYAVIGFVLYLTIIGIFRRYAVGLGYLFFFVIIPLLPAISQRLGATSLSWLLIAAITHLTGLIFRNKPDFPYAEPLWQAFVIAAIVLQYFAILSMLV
jgi:hemolysin III